MTKPQTSLYWRTWSQVRKTLIEFGGYCKEDADAERHLIHIEALGSDKSSTALTNRDLDKILDKFRIYLVIPQGPSSARPRAETQPINRLIHSIDQLGLPEPYLAAIARDQFSTSEWRKLSETELTKFRFTATNRARQKTKAS